MRLAGCLKIKMSKRKFFCVNVSYYIFTFLPMKEKRFRFLSVFPNKLKQLRVGQGVNFLYWKFSKSHGLRFIFATLTMPLTILYRNCPRNFKKTSFFWQKNMDIKFIIDLTKLFRVHLWIGDDTTAMKGPFEWFKMIIFFQLFPWFL